jgi:ribosomal protein L5
MLHTLPQTKGVELCRLKHHYDSILRYDLMQKLIIQNTHQTPKLEKIILSSSVSYKPQQVRGLENIAAKNSGDGVGKSNAAATNKKNVARKAASSSKAREGNKMPI